MPQSQSPPLPSSTLSNARRLRSATTEPEQKLWYLLRDSRLAGHKFRRQHPIPPFILDFVCLRARVIVELDGSQHSLEADAERTRALQARGFEVLRFWDNDALVQIDNVAMAILSLVERRTLTPAPLPEGEGF